MAIDFSNYINTYKGSPVLQQQFPNMNDYLALFGYNQGTTPSAATTSTTPSTGTGVQSIINQNINQFQQGGGGGLPTVPTSQRVANFNQAIDTRQNRLNNPSAIASFFYEKGVPRQASVNEMLSRGMLGAKDTRLTSGIPFGISGMIAGALPDKYYDMTLGDQILTQSYMGYTDPNTNMANKDPFGLNVRSAFGNYSKKAQEIVDTLNEKKARNKGVLSDYDLQRLSFYTGVVNKKQNIASDLALIQKAKEEKAKQDAAKAAQQTAGLSGLTTQGGGRGIASEGVRSGRVDAAGMGGGSRQAKSSGSQNTGRTDGGWGWKEGGSVMSEKEMKKLSETPLYKGFKKMYSVDSSMAKDNPAYSKKYKVFEELYKKGYQKGGLATMFKLKG